MSRERSSRAPVSAQVILRSASGAAIRGDTPITSANIRDYVPSPEDAAAAQEAFAARGFEVGPLVGISFSITAPAETFESTFGARLRDRKGRVHVTGAPDADALQLPLAKLPESLARRIVAVTFTPPAEIFGAGEAR